MCNIHLILVIACLNDVYKLQAANVVIRNVLTLQICAARSHKHTKITLQLQHANKRRKEFNILKINALQKTFH